jgi:hypothetical protein
MRPRSFKDCRATGEKKLCVFMELGDQSLDFNWVLKLEWNKLQFKDWFYILRIPGRT